MRRHLIGLGLFTLAGVYPGWATGGFDIGRELGQAEQLLASDGGEIHGSRGWLRIHAHSLNQSVRSDETDDPVSVQTNRAILSRLHATGWRVACMIRWAPTFWASGVRIEVGPGVRAPLDLREAHARARMLAATYGDLVDAWEIDNEPDIPFFAGNADVFASYYKAVALGLAEGRGTQARVVDDPSHGSAALGQGVDDDSAKGLASSRAGWSPPILRNPKASVPIQRTPRGQVAPPPISLVLMPAMALPPGPYFEQLCENGLLGYTEGFNYHYYGFAMDYAGVYSQFRDIVTALGGKPGGRGAAGAAPGTPATRHLPVFLTEWGYSLLDGYDAQRVDGRVRQWRYFKAVARENDRLGIGGPMAFLFRPYFEHGAKEFGLVQPMAGLRAEHFGFEVADEERACLPEFSDGDVFRGKDEAKGMFKAGGMGFTPADFGANRVAPWMARIGGRAGEGEVSPALAWMLEQGQRSRSRRSREWVVNTEPPSPVVLDFIPGENTQAVKTFHGYWLAGQVAGATARSGKGVLVMYNFSAKVAKVDLPWIRQVRTTESGGGETGILPEALRIALAPGERREIAVILRAQADAFLPEEIRLAADVRCGETSTVARWASRFYAQPDEYAVTGRRGFDFAGEAAATNCARLLTRPRAPEEPALKQDGRWLVTEGMRVEETPDGWRLHVDHFPGVALRPAVAELPLPERWKMPAGTVLIYDYRLTPETGAVELRADDPDPTRRRQTGKTSAIAESYIRMTNGNLFSTVPRLSPKPDWRRYNQSAETFTMFFLGRTKLPWRFADNTPASLVFFVRPTQLPAVFEVRDPHLAALVRAPEAK